jgi:hypothetical protein
LVAFGQALGVSGGEIDHKADDRARFVIAPQNADAAQFDQSGERLGWTYQKSAADGLKMDAIVTDEAREGDGTTPRGLDQLPGQPRFARPRGPADQDRAWTDEHRRSVHGCAASYRH